MALTDKLKAIGNAIRAKTGGTEELTLDQMVTEIEGIEGGSGGGGEMTDVGAEVLFVIGGQRFTYAELVCMAEEAPMDMLFLIDQNIMTFVMDELHDLYKWNTNLVYFGVTKSDGKAYYYDSGVWHDMGEDMGMPNHGWIDKSVFESLDYTNEANFGVYAVRKTGYPLIDRTLTTLVSDAEVITGEHDNFCGLNTVRLPKATTIGRSAFSNCRALTNVDIPNVSIIGDSAFYNCDSLISVNMQSVISLSACAFEYCKALTSIIIPSSTRYVGYKAFSGCTNLTSITFNGSVSQWNAIQFEDEWNEDVPATEVVCSDGVVSLV